MGGVAIAASLGRPNLICVDMGGTSFDVSLITDGKPDYSSEASLEGFPFLIPAVNIHTIGAGGGSLAYIEGGGLRVGPESAGADPGPVCYGRGGTQPTVTDANLVLGRIDPDYFLGGRMGLDVEGAKDSIATLAAELGLEPTELAEGIVEVVNAKMAQAIRTITVEQGIEPRDYAIVAYGGAGPMHAVFLAQELEIGEVIVPESPGTFSAWGMLQTEIRHDFAQPYFRPLAQVDSAHLQATFEELEQEGFGMLTSEGVGASGMRSQPSVEMRYEGQEYTLNVPIALADMSSPAFLEALAQSFHAVYQVRYGHASEDAPVELVAVRLAALGDLGRPEAHPNGRPGSGAGHAIGDRDVVIAGATLRASIVKRADIPPSGVVTGPAIIEEPTATTVVPPGAEATADPFGPLVIRL
jgi:N-methylhydantoinase A